MVEKSIEIRRLARANSYITTHGGKLQSFPTPNWISLNHAIGWTKEATITLSSCKNAVLKDIFKIWNTLDFRVAPDPNYKFAALLINPPFLPENCLAKIIECGAHNIISVR